MINEWSSPDPIELPVSSPPAPKTDVEELREALADALERLDQVDERFEREVEPLYYGPDYDETDWQCGDTWKPPSNAQLNDRVKALEKKLEDVASTMFAAKACLIVLAVAAFLYKFFT